MATETFSQWLIDHGYEAYVHDEGEGDLEVRDGTIEDRPGLLQSLFSSQYAAWLHHLLSEYGIGADVDGDGLISVHSNQNNPDVPPEIEGMTAEELAGIFSDPDDFIWLSSVNPRSSEHTVTHERFYWDAFTSSADPAANGDGVGNPTSPTGNNGAATSSPARIHLSDAKFAFDLDGAAGNSVRMVGAAFGPEFVTPEFVGVGLNLFDAGMTKEGVAGLVLGTSLFHLHAGSTNNVDFVNHVFENVVGRAPSADEADHFVGLLQGSGGTMTQAELLALAADSDANAQHLNLVGLQASGVEFV